MREGYDACGDLDVELISPSPWRLERRSERERAADRQAAEWLVPAQPLEGFIAGRRPYFSASHPKASAQSGRQARVRKIPSLTAFTSVWNSPR